MTPHPDHTRALVHAEELTVGTAFTLGIHTPSRQEITDFARSWGPLVFHLEGTDPAAGGWGDVIASGAHTIAIFQRLSVLHIEHDWAVIAGIGMTDVRFPQPVRPDEPLTGHARIDAVEMVRADRALVVKSGSLTGPTGSPVLTLVTRAYVRRRPTPGSGATTTGAPGADG